MPREMVPHDWVGHEHTKRLVTQWRGELKDAQASLMSSARRSNDPEVRADHANVVTIQRFIAQLMGGDMKEQEADEV